MAVKQYSVEHLGNTGTIMQNDIENIIGVLDDTMDTMNKSDVLRNNLIQQQIEIEKHNCARRTTSTPERVSR